MSRCDFGRGPCDGKRCDYCIAAGESGNFYYFPEIPEYHETPSYYWGGWVDKTMLYRPNDGYPVFRDHELELRLVEETLTWLIVCRRDKKFTTILFRYFNSGYDYGMFSREEMEFLITARIFHTMKNAFKLSFCQKIAKIIITFETEYSEESWGLFPGELGCIPSSHFCPQR